MSGESRSELLLWLNTLLEINYTKIEQCGTGAAYCQILDSIFQDLPMGRVKFNATQEYEYLTNYKILQSAFSRHKIEKTVYVDKLVKCRFQDNLEFLQWMKRYWMDNKDESEYDAGSRRSKGATGTLPPSASTARPVGSRPVPAARGTPSQTPRSQPAGTAKRSSIGVTRTTQPVTRTAGSSRPLVHGGSLSGPPSRVRSRSAETEELQAELASAKESLEQSNQELNEYKEAVQSLETERDFYFNKLREIEILTQTTSDLVANGAIMETPKILSKIQEILYSTEEGFQAPDPMQVEPETLITDEETF